MITNEIEQARLNKERDITAASYRAICGCIVCSTTIIGVHLFVIYLTSSGNNIVIFCLVLSSFTLCLSVPIVYILWYLRVCPINAHHHSGTNDHESVDITSEQDFNKEYRYLIDGFIRIYFANAYALTTTDSKQMYYPDTLKQIINKHINYGFDVCPEPFKCVLEHHGILVNTTRHDEADPAVITVGCLSGFSTGINRFKIKCIECNPNDSLGVISNVNMCNDVFDLYELYLPTSHINRDYNAFYYTNEKGTFYSGTSQYLRSIYSKKHRYRKIMKWTANTVITMTVDCINWKIYFEIKAPENDEQITVALNLMANETYHPLLSVSLPGSKYLLLQKCLLNDDYEVKGYEKVFDIY
eukprot:270854_1